MRNASTCFYQIYMLLFTCRFFVSKGDKMIIKNGKLLNDNFVFKNADIAFNNKITNIAENISGDEVFDASDCYVIPGLVETHMHGAMGETFLDFKNTYINI